MEGQVVQTKYGRVRGGAARLPDVTAFKGIPYGATTAGANRWRPPQPPEPWSDVLEATTFGDVAPQLHDTGGLTASEDCLNLNVWTPAGGGDRGRPVYVWLHGGRFAFGSGAEPVYDGAALAAKGCVVVTANVRLGVFGYLATPELSAESGRGASGNYGLLDAVAVVQWVHDNIASFGGDPERVTIGGHSSGGATCLALIYSPLAGGLFQQAIIESAAYYPKDPAISTLAPSHRDLPQAEQDGIAYGAARGAATLEDLRALPAGALLEGSDVNDPSIAGTPPPPLFRPVVDGWVLPRSYWDTLTTGAANPVTVLTGNNRDESGAKLRQSTTVDDYVGWASDRYGDLSKEFLALYPATDDETAGNSMNAAYREGTRTSTWMWASEFAKHSTRPVFTYFWDHTPPGPDGEARGAFHGAEMPYFFNNLQAEERPYTQTDPTIADRMSDYVSAFVATGDPNGDGRPVWHPVDPSVPVTLEVGDVWQPLTLARPEKVAFIAKFFATQKAW